MGLKLFRCCPMTLRLLPLCPSNAGSAGARASAYKPPTTACGATSVFETPSVLRESLPSYSAKPGAFYAPRALRWTTPARGRTDPFQGPKMKPIVHRFSMPFQDDFGVENGGQNDAKLQLKSSLGAFQDALGAGCRAMRFSEALGSLLGLPGTPKIVLPLQCGHNFCLNRGGSNHSGPKSRPKASLEPSRWRFKSYPKRLRFGDQILKRF